MCRPYDVVALTFLLASLPLAASAVDVEVTADGYSQAASSKVDLDQQQPIYNTGYSNGPQSGYATQGTIGSYGPQSGYATQGTIGSYGPQSGYATQGTIGSGLPGPRAPVMAAAPANPSQQTPTEVNAQFQPTREELTLPLDAGIKMDSDDGVWISSRRRTDPRPEDFDYDTNYVLSMLGYWGSTLTR
eukprot:TRINITY_DN12600_c0_g1_i1.p2 TRINITY_DN12600_c0_g1~~TRINITY_DN12600_c0_g1_i1.p2  ORF type:complete len:188 (+),score=41.35 TRINITY_DN12600_c0_g1_i1:117-680(+)